jgi:outer membrane cobalamin receptor
MRFNHHVRLPRNVHRSSFQEDTEFHGGAPFVASLNQSGYIFSGSQTRNTLHNPFTLFSSIIILLTAGVLSQATAQLSPVATVPVDSSKHLQTAPLSEGDSLARQTAQPADSLMNNDSTAAVVDTLGRMSTPTLVGTYDRSLEERKVLTKEDLHWLDYRYLGGIIESMPGTFVRDQNSAGQYNQLNIRGADWRSIAITMDGRLLNDPASGIFNLFHFTTEYADRIEIITGPRAFIYGLNSTGGAINLVTKNYNSNKPFTKVNYSESIYNAVCSDGTFSQNISRKVNFTFGFQHQGTDGKFLNSEHDAWNGRVKVRYNFSPDFNIILSEYHTTTKTQMNGGVDYALSGPVNGLDPFATVKNLDSYEKITRNDVDLSFVGTFLGDSVNVSMLTFYYSHSIREYRDEEDLTSSTANGIVVKSDHVTSWTGARLSQNFDTDFQRFSLGANLELRQVEGSPNLGRQRNVIGSLWAKEDLLLTNQFTLAAFGRFDQYLDKTYTGIGTDATMRVTDGLSLFAGMSLSRRMPNYQELFWIDSIVARAASIEAEKHIQLEIGMDWSFPDRSYVRASYFHRTVEDAIQVIPYATQAAHIFPSLEFVNVPKVVSNGFEAKIGVRVWELYIEGTGTYMIQTSDGFSTQLFPKIWANGGIYYWNTLLNHKLEFKVGFRGRYQSSHLGAEFNPEVLAYVLSASPALGQAASGDFFVTAHIGDAYIHLMWENLTSVEYFSTPFYPVLERALRLGVSWEFLD